MPTASTAKLEKQGSLDANDPLRQGIVMIDHKIRNLEKRKAKLDGYRDLQKSGKDLNSDQLEAISKYDAVIQHLDFARELSKHLTSLALESVKNAKKQARKEAQEKAQQEIARTKEILMIQDVMSSMGQDSVRDDLTQGKAKVTLTAEELQQIDDLYVELTPKREEHALFQDMFQAPAEAMSDLLKGKNKEVCGTTYTALKEKIFEIIQSGYFDNAQPEPAQENVEVVTAGVEAEAAVPEDNGTDTEVAPPLPQPQTIPEDPSVIACSFQPSHVVVPQNASTVPLPVQPVEEPIKPAQIETAYFTPTLRAFQSATIDFMQTDLTIQENDVEPGEPAEAPPIPTMTYTNQSFTPMDPSQTGQPGIPPPAAVVAPGVLPPQVLPPPVPAQAIPVQEPPQIYQNQTDEEKGWSNVGGEGHHQPMVMDSEWNEVIDNNGGGGEDSWASQSEQTWSTNQQPPSHNDGFITQGGRGRGGQRRGGGGGDRNPKGNYRGGSRGGQGNRSGGGGFRDKEGGGGYREGGGYNRDREGGYGGGNSYKDQNSYQNGYQNRGERSGGRQGPRNPNDRPAGGRGGGGGGRGRGGYRGGAGGGYRQQQQQ